MFNRKVNMCNATWQSGFGISSRISQVGMVNLRNAWSTCVMSVLMWDQKESCKESSRGNCHFRHFVHLLWSGRHILLIYIKQDKKMR